uniref:Calcyclin-binding protein n=1 Tax=Panstrongylus megistus TaxID=65343 RepID=A0A069DR20_9HEMI
MLPSKIDQLRSDVEELKRLENTASRPHVKDILSIEIRKLETEIIKLMDTSSEVAVSSSIVNASAKNNSAAKCYDVKITNYAWDQSDKFVKLFVSLKDVQTLDKDQISCTFASTSIELNARGLENKNYIFTIKGLLHQIEPSSSYWKVKTDSVVIFLAKVKQGTKWSHLTSNEVKPKPDFSADDLDSNGDPTSGLMNMFKKMYEEGDDDMKRTIAKAWTESREKQKMDF